MQARTTPAAADPPAYQWVTGASSGDVITFDRITNLCVFGAPEADMAAMSGSMVYDCRLELPGGGCVPLFAGRIVWTQGVTRTASDAAARAGVSGLGDTVTVDGEGSAGTAPLPLSLTAAIAVITAGIAGLPLQSAGGDVPVDAGNAYINDSGFVVIAQ